MDFLCACFSEKLYDTGRCCTSYNRVINENNALASYCVSDWVKLDLNRVFTLGLERLDKCSAYVSVLEKTYAVRDARFFCITHSCIKTGVRNTADDVSINRVGFCEEAACLLSCFVNACAFDYRVRTCKVYIFKYAETVCRAGALLVYLEFTVYNFNDFARLNITEELCADRVESAGFGCEYIAALKCTDAERTEAVRVTGCDHLSWGHDKEGVGAFKLFHSSFDSFFDRGSCETFLCDEIGDNFCVVCCVENNALISQFFTDLNAVYEITVVSENESTFSVSYNERLCVYRAGLFLRSISYMADSHLAERELFHYIECENFRNKADILYSCHNTAVVNADTAGFLTSVLESIKTELSFTCYVDVRARHCCDAENTALVMDDVFFEFKFFFCENIACNHNYTFFHIYGFVYLIYFINLFICR